MQSTGFIRRRKRKRTFNSTYQVNEPRPAPYQPVPVFGSGNYVLQTSLQSPPQIGPATPSVHTSAPSSKRSGMQRSLPVLPRILDPGSSNSSGALVSPKTFSDSPRKLVLSDKDTPDIELPDCPPVTSGGSCELYVAVHRPSQTKLAMKRPRIHFPTDEMLKRFLREAKTWSQLEHDNILPLFGIMQINYQIYLVSPWMPLGDLLAFVQRRHQYVKQHKLTEKHADDSLHPAYATFTEARIIQEIASGMEYLHSINVVHGDMKAKNVLLDDHAHAQICDFGLTKTPDHSVTSTEVKGVGSVRWQSPEIMRDVPKSTKSDVYAFGMTIAEILSADYPYPHLKTQTAVVFAVMLADERPAFKPLSRLGVDFEPLWDLAAKCWKTEAEDRPSMTEVLRRMGRFTSNNINLDAVLRELPNIEHPVTRHLHETVPDFALLPLQKQVQQFYIIHEQRSKENNPPTAAPSTQASSSGSRVLPQTHAISPQQEAQPNSEVYVQRQAENRTRRVGQIMTERLLRPEARKPRWSAKRASPPGSVAGRGSQVPTGTYDFVTCEATAMGSTLLDDLAYLGPPSWKASAPPVIDAADSVIVGSDDAPRPELTESGCEGGVLDTPFDDWTAGDTDAYPHWIHDIQNYL